ncbi:MAG: adenylate/guanylate cyclase domain-containing protein [Opitutae bacterium]|nr:adenylate/guanylate cyclase domain-containing protein [Opitutae bacterium]
MAKTKAKLDWRMLLLLPIPLLWCWAASAGLLTNLEHMLLDLRFRSRGPLAAPVDIHYVNVDSRAIQSIGERPWNRAKFAEVARLLFEEGGAKAVGFDFVFSEQGHSDLVDREAAAKGNVALGRVARKHPELILAAQYTGGDARTQQGIRQFPFLRSGFKNREKNDTPELPQYPIMGATLTQSWGTIGLIDVDLAASKGETPRWVPLFAESIGPTFWHMGVQLACVQLGLPPSSARRAGSFVELVKPSGEVVRRIPVSDEQTLETNWFSEWNSSQFNPQTSVADVLVAGEMLKSEKEAERAEARDYFSRFKGGIVLIGPTDPLLQDLAPTPFDSEPVPKVGLHGNIVKTIVAERYLHRTPSWFLWVATLVLTLAVALLTITGGARSLFFKILALLALAGYAVVAFYVFRAYDWVLPMTAPLSAAFTTGFIATIIQLVDEEKQKGRIKGMFSAYLAPTVVNSLIDSGKEPELGGHEETITAYFSDIQSFSSFSEMMSHAALVDLMNEYFTACTDIITEEGGTLDKYIGDAVVAMFGAPVPLSDHAYRACVASIRVQRKIDELRVKWRSEGGKWPVVVHNLRARLGMNTGGATVGNMGSRTRFNYTMMGDTVNLAARMESGAKLLGVYTMVADQTRIDCEKHGGDRIVFRFLDRIKVKGKNIPTGVHEVVGFKDEISAQTLECLALHARAVERYHAQDWLGAIALFEQSAKLEPHQPNKSLAIESNPSLIMIERCHHMKEHPPGANWDGVFVMKEKG